ncbi:DNA-binding transcriptional regulator, LysR family [Bosea sp. OK403]|uniref:LysR family transcriptional regulator n=1 Tax=Bosea sp. OK403 TaxID=1855286 RepID=UPI0008ED77BA|nr:LysR family transcriptional regulator [Bosea sp. OK403]SFJ88459.1 DNA-binding transcriptional regulator, LysR family [Bosea sp. OK403]
MNIDVRQLRAFITLAQFGSFTRAAGSLNLSQPALTVQIQKLEDGLGVRLFDRNTRSVSLTRIGRELAPQLGRILSDLDAVVGDTRQLAQGQQGVVRLAVLPSYASGILPEIIAAFRRTNPQVSFIIRDVIASRVAELTRQEQVDLGIMGGALSDPDLEVLHRTQDHMHVVFPDGHKLGNLDSVTIDDIAPLPLVLMDPATSVRAIVDAAFLTAGHRPIVGAEATYMSTAVGMVRAGLGVAILPGSAMEVRAEQTLRSRPLKAADFARQIALIKRSGRTLPPASESFAQMLMKELPAAQGADTA